MRAIDVKQKYRKKRLFKYDLTPERGESNILKKCENPFIKSHKKYEDGVVKIGKKRVRSYLIIGISINIKTTYFHMVRILQMQIKLLRGHSHIS